MADKHLDGVATQAARRKVGFLNACKDGRVKTGPLLVLRWLIRT